MAQSQTIVIPYKPLPYQRRLHDDPHRFRTVVAGRRVGKTTFAVNELLKLAIKRRLKARYWYVAPYRHQAKTIAWEMLLKTIPQELLAKKPNETELSFDLVTGDSIELKGTDTPTSLEGTALGALVADEVGAISHWRTLWVNSLRPMLSDYESPAIFISKPYGFNHFHTLAKMGDHDGIIEGEPIEPVHLDPDFTTYRFETEQNCREHNGGYIAHEEIETARRQLGDAFAQEYQARFINFTGLVYKGFSRQTHVKELDDFQPVYYLRGLDRGFTNPSASPIIAVDADGTWYQTHELYETGLTNPPLSEALNRLQEDAQVKEFEFETMDSANAGDLMELNNLGHTFIGVRKEPGEGALSYVRWKIQKFAERLRVRDDGRPRYFVHPRCVNTIREFETYRWPDDTPEKNPAENPLKLNDHMMDALADLNGMYEHLYEPEKKHPWDGKLPGTFIPPSMPEEDDNDWGRPIEADYGADEY